MATDSIPPLSDPGQIIAALQERMSRLTLPKWTVFGLVGLDDQAWLCGVGEDQCGVRAIRIDYRPLGSRERLIVQTQPSSAGTPRLARALDQLERDVDEGEPFQLLDDPQHPSTTTNDGQTDVLLDHQAVPATQQRRGVNRAWSLRTHGVTIVAAARHAGLESVALHQITDLEPLKQRRTQVIEQFLRAKPHRSPPHRSS